MEAKWTQEMSVGDNTIDNQHKKLLNKLNELKTELSSGVDMGPLRKILDFFEKYVNEHLNYEESYMKEHNYPEFNNHKKIHDSYRKYFENFKQKFSAAYTSSTFSSKDIKVLLTEAEEFLTNWWINHILKEDHKYAAHIRLSSK